jgi:hypothetical protein
VSERSNLISANRVAQQRRLAEAIARIKQRPRTPMVAGLNNDGTTRQVFIQMNKINQNSMWAELLKRSTNQTQNQNQNVILNLENKQ